MHYSVADIGVRLRVRVKVSDIMRSVQQVGYVATRSAV